MAVACRSSTLGGAVQAEVYLPSGYRGGTRRYPVIYFLHGLPAGPTAYTSNGFVAAALASSGKAALVVTPQGPATPTVTASTSIGTAYFEATGPSGQHVLDLGSDAANWMARVPRGTRLKARLKTNPTLIAFYVGRRDARPS